MEITNLAKRMVILLLVIWLSTVGAFADLQNFGLIIPNGTLKNYSTSVITKGKGFVQFIKGSPSNPPTGTANSGTPAFSGNDTYAICKDTDNQQLLNSEIKGAVGDYIGYGAGDGGFALKNKFDHLMNTAYYIRYWTEDGYYGNSNTLIPWSGGEPVPADPLTYNSFTLYKASAPYAPTIINIIQKEAVEQELAPNANAQGVDVSQLVISFNEGTKSQGDADIQVKGDNNLHKIPYEIYIKKGGPPTPNDADFTFSSASSPITIDKKGTEIGKWFLGDPNATYFARVGAYNYFGGTLSDPVQFKIVTPGAMSPTQSFPMKFISLVLNAKPGINFFSMPFGPDKEGKWYAAGKPIQTAYDLVIAINIAAKEKDNVNNVVSTFGKWNNADQSDAGVPIRYQDVNTNNSINNEDVTTLKGINLTQGEGYQVYVKKDVELLIKNTP